MTEVELFSDEGLVNKIDETIDFGIIKAGESTDKIIYVRNNIDVPVNLEIGIEGDFISFKEVIDKLEPKQVSRIILTANPNVTVLKPITGKLNIKYNFML